MKLIVSKMINSMLKASIMISSILFAIVLIIILVIVVFRVRFFPESGSDEAVVLLTDERAFLNWDLSYAEPWDELIVNQTDASIADQQPHSVSFYRNGLMVKTVKIPIDVVFWLDEDHPVTVFHAPKSKSLFIYQGIRHLSSEYTYGLHRIMTIGDGFFAKCYMYQNYEDNSNTNE